MERFFQILAVILIGVAAYFLWRENNDGVFVSAVLGAVCFFLSVRFQIKERLKSRDEVKQKENFTIEKQSHRDFENDSTDGNPNET
ncbi:MAG: hypothetical protein LC768_05110 [Acidobacteria bacterium]|nr:hypothetical protein [Acidobacteriota bacterium]MCA1637706.1 hypothetical protein [Acidobacteriota bacterium]